MKNFSPIVIFGILSLLHLSTINAYICDNDVTTSRGPTIGVLAQESWNNGSPPTESYIVSGYVKFLEMAGAQVVPVLLNKNSSYYNKLYSKINGLLLPGGVYQKDSLYMKTAKLFWQKATNDNPKLDWRPDQERQNNYFPIWGTCLGFETMIDFVTGETSGFTRCSAFDTADSVNLTQSDDKLRKFTTLFKDAPQHILDNLRKQKTTVNYHRRCMNMKNTKDLKLKEIYRIIGTNEDTNGVEHLSIIESIHYPFYGVQFHPEAVLFEHKNFPNHKNVPHTLEAIQVSQYFANFFVQQASKNKNCFKSEEELYSYSIHNSESVFTAKRETDRYMEKYFFPIEPKDE